MAQGQQSTHHDQWKGTIHQSIQCASPYCEGYVTMCKWAACCFHTQRRQERVKGWETCRTTWRIREKKHRDQLLFWCTVSCWYVLIKDNYYVWPLHSVGKKFSHAEVAKNRGNTMSSDTDIHLLSCILRPHWLALGPAPCLFLCMSVCVFLYVCAENTHSKPSRHRRRCHHGSIYFGCTN